MSAIQVLIVEDDFLVAENIRENVRKLGYEVSAVVDNGKAAIEQVIHNTPDIAIFDIRIKGDLDGIDTASIISKDHQVPIIYLTDQSDQETYERAKATGPHAFLSKPITPLSLQRSLELAIIRCSTEKTQEPDQLKQGAILKKRIMLKVENSLHSILLEDIEWVKASSSYCTLKTVEKEWLISRPMGKLLDSLYQNEYCKRNIIRISRSVSINVQKLDSISGNKVKVGTKEFKIGSTFRDSLFAHLEMV